MDVAATVSLLTTGKPDSAGDLCRLYAGFGFFVCGARMRAIKRRKTKTCLRGNSLSGGYLETVLGRRFRCLWQILLGQFVHYP